MARPAPDLLAPRIAPASRLTSFGGYRPAVCGHPTDMILTRAHRSSDLLRKRASPGGYFTRALYVGSQNHAGPANLLALAFASGVFAHCANHRQAAATSRDSRLSGLGPSLRRLISHRTCGNRAFTQQPRHNRPSCRIQDDSDSTILHP